MINIELEPLTESLNEVVVVGFGTQRKVNLTGAVVSVDTRSLESRPITSVGQALQGVVPGLNFSVNSSGGALGNNMQMNIRGTGTVGLGSNAEPLVLIDGIEGNMYTVNPEDIENISVLKDASSSSIYGSRAAFGVILITTKKGREGKVKINYNNNIRYSGPINLPKSLDSYQFAQFFNETSVNQGDNPVFNTETMDRILAYQQGKITTTTIPNGAGTNWEFHEKANDNIDWYDTHFKWSWSQEHNLNLNGGTERLQYYASAGFLHQNGNLTFGDDSYQRVNLMAKVNAKITDYLDFNVNAKFIRWELDNPFYMEDSGLLFHDIARIWPMMPFKDPNGYYMRNGKINQLVDGGRSKTMNDNLFGQAQVVIKPLKGWNIYGEIGARVINQNKHMNLAKIYEHDVKGNPLALPFAASYDAEATFARDIYANTNFWNSNIYTDYTRTINDHYFKVLLGMNTEYYHYKDLNAQRSDVISDLIPEINASTGDDKINGAANRDWSTAGFFGRLNYSYKDRYLLEFNLRYDGSSRFLRNQRWNWFPSFSLGWNIANEAFFGNLKNYVSTLKPRFSWGKLGNQNTSSFYPFYPSQPVSPNGGGWLMNGSRPTTAGVPSLISEFMTWEKIYNSNIGLDVAMLRNRLNISFDYYIRKTEDMVAQGAEIGAVFGTGLPNINNATLDNRGWELQIGWKDQIGRVNYGASFNLSDNRVKVIKYPNPSGSLERYYDGQILGDIWGYETAGIAKTDAEMQDWLKNNDQSKLGSNWGAGDIMYKNLDDSDFVDGGANTITDHGDRKIIGNNNPRFRFGFNLWAGWKGFDISMFFQGVMKRDVWLSGPFMWGADGGRWQSVAFKEHLDYFRPADTDSYFGANVNSYLPKAYIGGRGDKNKLTQTRYLQNAAYLRLKNIQIGYQLPKELCNKIGLEKIRVFATAENLFTASKIAKMYDPEAFQGGYSSGKTYPLSRTYAFGINVTL